MAPSDTGSCTQRMPCGIHALLNLLSLQHFPSPEALPELLPELSVFGNYKVVETLSQPNQKLPNLPIFFVIKWFGVFKTEHDFFLLGLHGFWKKIYTANFSDSDRIGKYCNSGGFSVCPTSLICNLCKEVTQLICLMLGTFVPLNERILTPLRNCVLIAFAGVSQLPLPSQREITASLEEEVGL